MNLFVYSMVRSAWPPQPNRGNAVVAGGKPEVAFLRVHLIDVCFPRPERRELRRLCLQPHNGKVSRIDPDSTVIEKLLLPPGFYFQDIGLAGKPIFVSYQRETIVGIRQRRLLFNLRIGFFPFRFQDFFNTLSLISLEPVSD